MEPDLYTRSTRVRQCVMKSDWTRRFHILDTVKPLQYPDYGERGLC